MNTTLHSGVEKPWYFQRLRTPDLSSRSLQRGFQRPRASSQPEPRSSVELISGGSSVVSNRAVSGGVEWDPDPFRKTGVLCDCLSNQDQDREFRALRPQLLVLVLKAIAQNPGFPMRTPFHTAPPTPIKTPPTATTHPLQPPTPIASAAAKPASRRHQFLT